MGLSRDFDYNDIRISLGTEWTPLATTGFSGNFEIGYAFYRQLFYVNGVEVLATDYSKLLICQAPLCFG